MQAKSAKQNPYAYRNIALATGKPRVDCVGDRIKTLRSWAGLSRKQLSALCETAARDSGIKVTPGDLAGYENHRWSPKAEKLALLCDAFGVSAELLCGYTSAATLPGASNKGRKRGKKAA